MGRIMASGRYELLIGTRGGYTLARQMDLENVLSKVRLEFVCITCIPHQ